MTNAITKFDKVLRILKVNRLLSYALVPALVWVVMNLIWLVAGFFWWVLFLIIAVISRHLFQYAFTLITVFYVLGRGVDAEDSEVEEIILTIKDTPDEIIGQYLDHEFYAWLDLIDQHGNVQRATFVGTADLTRTVALPARCIMLVPGLIYELSLPPNSEV